ncbi:DUF3732 domain-containing protein [Bacillus cereus]|uniref:DUF3732 domain-containing protein n=1 Tax=Bacillus cereus TaxID=1396 RepID=UPI001443C850|nr:DUF3732 domain-containing protein [Bacillus cereus]MDA1913634.1 DUF3732 domain-containing protein [Bacillus cereus]MDA2659755.1 DUF3732 domain-containing protein [Bacillus cereus]NKX61472.1 DUF3732 domain-containing protein [Bacillus cereus]
MKRWNIHKIFLYSHHEEMNKIEFDLEDVNIITGDSQTGKSAIPEILDYLMGSSECHIPSYVRSCLSWVGILWVKDSTKFALFRKIPKLGKKSSQKVYFDIGMDLKIPSKASEIKRKTNLKSALNQFERLLGIGDIKTTESFNNNNITKRITVRNTMPYLIQDDDVVISKNTLLRGANETDKIQSILQSLPYFFGVIDEHTLEKELEFNQVKKQIERMENRVEINKKLLNNGNQKALSLVQEAAQLGLCDISDTVFYSELEIKSLLNDVLQWDLTQESIEREDKLPDLHNLLVIKQTKIIDIKNKIRAARNKLNVADDFNNTVYKQKRKLEIINIFKKPNDPHICPLCSNELNNEVKIVSTINELVNKVKGDLGSVERDRPKLDAYIQNLQKELYETESEVENLKIKIETLVKENEQVENKLNILERRYRTLGRISLYMETIGDENSNSINKDYENLEKLRKKFELLQDEVNIEGKIEALHNVERRLSSIATNIISKLPFENRYKDCPVFINLRNLNVGVSLPTHSENMRDVGSDENYLSLHVALLLAMHRHFAQLNNPVPGVLLFDQLSRPYFPPDKEPDEVELDNERSSLLTFFETLFDEVDRGESLQIIVLEHAYFKNHERYKSSVKYRWKKGQSGLIPKGWPEV